MKLRDRMSKEPTLNAAMLAELIRQVPQACTLLKMMANEDRLALLCQLAIKECHVAELEALLGIKQPTLSQQLGILRRSGGVQTRRQGKYIYYQVTDTDVLQLLLTVWKLNCAATLEPQAAVPAAKVKKKKAKPAPSQSENSKDSDDKQFQLL